MNRPYKSLLILLTLVALTSCTNNKPTTETSPTETKLKEQVLQIIRENPQVLIESVQTYQQEQDRKLQEARQAFLQQMTTNPAAVIGDSPTTGAPDKKIVLVEFSDFQCPVCAEAQKSVKQFIAKNKNKVTLTYKHLPLPQHEQAIPAAKASWAAGQQGKFWEYHDALFSQQKNLGEPLYLEIAKKLKLDENRFNQDRQSAAAEAAIQKDLQLAQSLGITGTPFFNLNGEPLIGAVQVADLEKVLAKVTGTNQTPTPKTETPAPEEQAPAEEPLPEEY
jgi:protein-disulfide isomerase